MREMIISELSQAVHDLARGFAHYLPRLIVMLVIAFAGWLIAYVIKVILRSILRLFKFDRLAENAGASQLLSKAALPSATEMLSRFVFGLTWLRLSSPGGERAGNPWLAKNRPWQDSSCFLAALVRGSADPCFSVCLQLVFLLALLCWRP